MNHIFYQTKTHFSNSGDMLINQALINALRQYGVLHTNCSRDIPTEFLDALQIQSEEKIVCDSELAFIATVLRYAVQSKKKGDAVYIFSGLGDLHGGGTRLVLRNFLSGLIFPIFRFAGVKIVRIGRSIGPISRMMEISERIRGIFLSHYYVRDSKSLRRCHKMGIKKAKYCPDMSWIYDPDHSKRFNHTKTVMINMRDRILETYDPYFAEVSLKKCEEMLAQLQKMIGPDMRVCIAYQVSEDKAFAHQIYEHLQDRYTVELIDHQMQLQEMKKYYRNTDIHISNRLHSLLVGYKYGSLPLALIDARNHVKIAATFEDCGIENLMFHIYESLSEERVFWLYNQREHLLSDLFKIEQQNQKEIHETLAFIFKMDKCV